MLSEEQKEILSAFGRHIAAVRKSKDLSYRKVASNCNLDASHIKRIENGEVNIALTTLVELAKGLGVPRQDLLEY